MQVCKCQCVLVTTARSPPFIFTLFFFFLSLFLSSSIFFSHSFVQVHEQLGQFYCKDLQATRLNDRKVDISFSPSAPTLSSSPSSLFSRSLPAMYSAFLFAQEKISLLGMNPTRSLDYCSDSGHFTCLSDIDNNNNNNNSNSKKMKVLNIEQINDGICDCQDGSDEPGMCF